MLADQAGCKILMREKRGFEELFIINEDYEAPLRKYTSQLPTLNEKLNERLLKILKG